MGRKFNNEFVNDIQTLLEHGFDARDLLARYPCVFTAQIYNMKSNFDFFGHTRPKKIFKQDRTPVLTPGACEVTFFITLYRLLLTQLVSGHP